MFCSVTLEQLLILPKPKQHLPYDDYKIQVGDIFQSSNKRECESNLNVFDENTQKKKIERKCIGNV